MIMIMRSVESLFQDFRHKVWQFNLELSYINLL